jgi:hypothetical protein
MSIPEIRVKWEEFQEEYNSYFISNEEIWMDNLNKVNEYINSNKKRPSDSDKNKDIKVLGSWIHCQQTNNTQNKCIMLLIPEIKVKWEEFLEEYKEYFQSNEETWMNNLNKVKEYINTNKKRPSTIDKNKDIQILGSWIGTQQKNYKKNKYIMLTPEIRLKWEEFLEEYNNYFNSDDNKSVITESTDITNKCEEDNDIIEETDEEEEIIIMHPKKSMKLNLKIKSKEHSLISSEHSSANNIKPLLSILHQKYKTMTSSNLHNEFQTNREQWSEYHNIVEKNEESFAKEEIPRNVIITELDKIKTKRTIEVVDLGCGKAQIASHYKHDKRFHFHNYDHVSFDNKLVIEQDISTLPLDDDSIEIAILSLAMWGSNCKEYITEAHRVLETSGKLYIIEPTKRWTNVETEPIEPADKLKQLLEVNKFKIMREKIDKFAMFVCMKT